MSIPSQHLTQHLGEQLQQRLSPQQVRFVRLLEMNRSEAEEAVERELADNPALERVEESETLPLTEDGTAFSESAEELQSKDYADPDEVPYYRLRTPSSGREDAYVPVTPDDGDDLYSSLLAQLGELDIDPDDRAVAEYVIGNLDSNGYLHRSPAGMLSDLSIFSGKDYSDAQMRRALEAVRSLDPAGVGAETLAQCMELQLRRMPPSQERDDALRIVAEAWDLFLKRHTHRLGARLHIDRHRAARAAALIARLNPKPGAAIGSGRGARAVSVVPDFIVDVDEAGHMSVSLAGKRPELAIEASFESAVKLMQNQADRRRVKGGDYISARYNDARDFILLLQQRRDTLMSVITAIVSLQRDFFLTADDAALRPMTLKDVAAVTGFDPSTISRSTSGKYVQTHARVLPLRHFFSEGYASGEGAEVSARQVQARIKKLVGEEDPRHPLSDEALCRLLADGGFDVSRRTVAKYRDRMGIPVARLRRN